MKKAESGAGQVGCSIRALAFAACTTFVLGIFTQSFFVFPLPFFGKGAAEQTTLIRQAPDKQYPLISPLLMVDVAASEQSEELSSLRSEFESLIATQRKNGDINSASIFFRNFTDGQWVSINPNAHYSPASLLKIPLMVAIFKEAQTHPGFLQREVFYDGSFDLNALEGLFTPSHPFTSGQSYTIEELVRHMVEYSDNNAVYLLSQRIDSNEENEVYTDLGLSIPPQTTNMTVDFMTVKNYASFFRVLYSSTYLTREYSEKALEFLSQSDFVSGIRGGVPDEVKVANKFGERTQYDASGKAVEQELHDCGIVYDAADPYLLCVMTKAPTSDGAAQFIRAISKTAYDFVTSQRGL